MNGAESAGRWSGEAIVGAGPAETAGHPAVDAAVRAMANAADLPLPDQIAQYEAAHGTLRDTLATIDDA
ncbi:hypothetical protein [Pilimelia columellifera]|uniref:Uncharacterized protein n=1 Tax=Pilimelia columellifera subsp. columellifera TaxID=706583 RepID=A0ABN3NQL7_9ACTN